MSSAVALLAQGIAVAQGGGTATVVQLPAEQQQQQQQQPPAQQQQQQQQQQASTSTVAGACCPLLQTRALPGCVPGALRAYEASTTLTRPCRLPVVQSTWCCG